MKKLPGHPDYNNEEWEDARKQITDKCEQVKEQLAKIRERLEELYEDEEEEQPRPEDLGSVNEEIVQDVDALSNQQKDINVGEEENFDQVAIAVDDEEIITYIRSPLIISDFFKCDELPEEEIINSADVPSPQHKIVTKIPQEQPRQQTFDQKPKVTQENMTHSLQESSNAFLEFHHAIETRKPSHQHSENFNQQSHMTQSLNIHSSASTHSGEVKLPRPLPGIAMKSSSRIIESSSTKNAAKLILPQTQPQKLILPQTQPQQPRQIRPSQSMSFIQTRPPPQYGIPQVPQNAPSQQQLTLPQQQQWQQYRMSSQPQISGRTQSMTFTPMPQTVPERYMERVVFNENIQQTVGNKIGDLATNEEIQSRVGNTVSDAVTNKRYQSMLGESIARNSDNVIVSSLARNEQVQSAIGTTVSKTVGNKEVQKAVGGAVKKVATDRETQQMVAKGFMTVAKGTWSGTKTIGKMAYDNYTNE